MANRKKQFIAGAICPQCSEMDSLVLYADDQSVACVSCDYQKSSEQRDMEAKQSPQSNKQNTAANNQQKVSFKNASLIDITHLDD